MWSGTYSLSPYCIHRAAYIHTCTIGTCLSYFCLLPVMFLFLLHIALSHGNTCFFYCQNICLQGDYVSLVGFVCLSVCDKYYSKCYEQILHQFYGGSGVVKGTSEYIVVLIWITMLTAQLKIWSLLNRLWTDVDEIFRIALQWYTEELIKFLRRSESLCWLSQCMAHLGLNINMYFCLCKDWGFTVNS